MSNIVSFESAKIPAHLKKMAAAFGAANDALKTSTGPTYPVLTIKGKVWGLVEDKVRTKITAPNEDGDEVPVQSLKVVIIKANPNLSKVFYRSEYEEGSEGLVPDCFSHDGTHPDKAVKAPEAKSCAACPHNVWGSGKEGKGRACSDSRRIAVAPEGQMDKVVLLRVPAASLKPLSEYATMLDKKGVPYQAVKTRLSFDPDAASPKLMFKAIGFVSAEEAEIIERLQDDELVKAIIGQATEAHADEAPLTFDEEEAAPAPAPAAKPKAAAKPKPAPKVEEVEEEAPAPAPAPKAAAKKAEAPAAEVEIDSELGDLLDGFDFAD